jgi:hypothetical protein
MCRRVPFRTLIPGFPPIMTAKGKAAIRASFQDALEERETREKRHDPLPGDDRPAPEGWGYRANQWPGAPADRMPPNCPVIPLGVADEYYVFMDSMQKLNRVKRTEWSKKILLDLFAATPNYPIHHWARVSPPKGKRTDWIINGMDVDDAIQCLMHACAERGQVEVSEAVRGRGAWTTGPAAVLPGQGEIVWHAGDAIFRVRHGKIERTGPAQIDGVVYPGAAPILTPWREPVPIDQSPAGDLFGHLKGWNYTRPVLDPVLVLGWMGAAFLGGALPWRPFIFVAGDRGTGKTTLRNLIGAVIGKAMMNRANATEANIRQTMGHQSLAVAIDELEGAEDNRRATAILDLARIAASGDTGGRGGAGGEPTSYTLRSTFWFSAINPPPMTVADKSRMALISLKALDRAKSGKEPVIQGDHDGRRLLRALMDAWPNFHRTFEAWRGALRSADMNDRAQMTYGVLLALAELMLGPEALEEHGIPIAEPDRLGRWVAEQTVSERAEQRANWSECIDRLFAFTIEAWRDGQKPTVGDVLERFALDPAADGHMTKADAQARLRLVGLSVREELWQTESGRELRKVFLAVPMNAEIGPAKVFAGTKYQGGGWTIALKQAPEAVVIHGKGNWQNIKVNGRTAPSLMVDLDALEAEAKTKGE